MRSTLLALLSFTSAALAANFNLVKEYSGSGFFDEWDYYGHWDDLTNGAPRLRGLSNKAEPRDIQEM